MKIHVIRFTTMQKLLSGLSKFVFYNSNFVIFYSEILKPFVYSAQKSENHEVQYFNMWKKVFFLKAMREK